MVVKFTILVPYSTSAFSRHFARANISGSLYFNMEMIRIILKIIIIILLIDTSIVCVMRKHVKTIYFWFL